MTYSSKKSLGICPSCHRPAYKGGVYCFYHIKINRIKSLENYKNLKDKKLCIKCKIPIESGALCHGCGEKDTIRQRILVDKRIKNGICSRCGKYPPRDGLMMCEKCCRAKSKQRNAEGFFLKRARCVCASHFKKNLEKYSLKGKGSVVKPLELAAMLRIIWRRQKGVCPISGRKLNRHNTELDHIIPKTQGGQAVPENLRFLHKDVNQAIRCLTDSDFLNLCKEVVSFSSLRKIS